LIYYHVNRYLRNADGVDWDSCQARQPGPVTAAYAKTLSSMHYKNLFAVILVASVLETVVPHSLAMQSNKHTPHNASFILPSSALPSHICILQITSPTAYR